MKDNFLKLTSVLYLYSKREFHLSQLKHKLFKKLKHFFKSVTLMTYYSILRSPDEHSLAALYMMMCRDPTPVV